MYEHVLGLWKRTCGETLPQNRTECLHAPQTTHQRGKTLPLCTVINVRVAVEEEIIHETTATIIITIIMTTVTLDFLAWFKYATYMLIT